MSILDQMNAIRRRQGLMPIDGQHIEGEPLAQPDLGELRVDPGLEPEPEPVFASAPPEHHAEPPIAGDPVVEFMSRFELLIHDHAALFRGRAVELTDAERAKIVKVVLDALRRSLDEQYREVAGEPRKRRREKEAKAQRPSVGVRAVSPTGTGSGDMDSPPAAKRRGRPPKQRLDGSTT